MSAEPRDKLSTPDGSDPIPDILEQVVGLYYLSPTFYVQQFCKSVLNQDPWAWTAEQLGGDWDAVKQASGSVRALASFNLAYSEALGQQLETVHSWTGDAKLAAQEHFQELRSAVNSQAAPLRDIGKELERAALAMYELGQFVGEALSALTDMAIIALIEIAAAKAAAMTGVGLVATGAMMGAAALQVTLMIKKWSDVLGMWTKVWTAVQGFMAAVLGGAALIENTALPELPEPSGV